MEPEDGSSFLLTRFQDWLEFISSWTWNFNEETLHQLQTVTTEWSPVPADGPEAWWEWARPFPPPPSPSLLHLCAGEAGV